MSRGARGALAALALIGLALFSARALRSPLSAGRSYSRAVYDRRGQLLRLTLSDDDQYRLWLPLGAFSKDLVRATLLQEDRHFRQHPGVNPASLARAFWSTYVARGRRIGGSTLTMQLARLRYGLDSRSILGKLKQLVAALGLEALYSKDEILEAYLNSVPYGGNIEGAGAASLVYFHRDASELTLPEALTLAVIPQNPNRRSLKAGPAAASLEGARLRLQALWDTHPVEFKLPTRTHTAAGLQFLAPHYSEALLQRTPGQARVEGSLDLNVQRLAERQLALYLKTARPLGIKNASILIVDHPSSEIRALVGSANYSDSSLSGQVNGALAKRSPGSALKPFLYGLAIDQGLIHPQSLLKDAPKSFGAFDPENFDGEFEGPLSATEALTHSRNLPAIELAAKVHDPSLYGFLRQAGITRLKEESFYGLSIALGGAETTLAELVRLYAMLAQGGLERPLRWMSGDAASSPPLRLLSPEASELVVDMLATNPRPEQGYSGEWLRKPLRVAWKTGTSHGFKDAWAVGIAGNYIVGVWVGNFDGSGNPSFVGRDAAGPLLFSIVDALASSDPEFAPVLPHTATETRKIHVCAVSGDLPGPYCKVQKLTGFIPGKSPIRTCQIHRAIQINPATGLRVCPKAPPPPGGAKTVVFEFWPSDLLSLFARAGIPRRVPPPYPAGCSVVEDDPAHGLRPEITSPKLDLAYILRSNAPTHIPLLATVDADVRALYWFSDGDFLGQVAPQTRLGEPGFQWVPRPGKHLIRVVDDHGRAAAREVAVTLTQ